MADEKQNVVSGTHNLTLSSRKSLHLDGVRKVESFHETGIVLETACGILNVTGKDLSVSSLNVDNGTLKVEGQIDALRYRTSESGLKRLFK